MADDEKSKNQILQALDALSHTFYQARATRRTTSLALPRSADGNSDDAVGVDADAVPAEPRPRSRRLSLTSPFRTRSKLDRHQKNDDEDDDGEGDAALHKSQSFTAVTPEEAAADDEKKGVWGWKPMRALSHIGMHRVGCLFSVDVVAAQGLPPSMNGLRLAVAVRRKETRDGALQTMPARVQKTAADFDETLYVRCHLYCSGGGTTGKPLRFEPRPFLLSAVAVDAPELDFGQNAVDFSVFVKEFTDKCQQGECPRQWDMSFPLAGKAKGGELVVKLAFQIMEDGGLGLVNSQPDGVDKTTNSSSSSSFARKLSKSSFSIMSPKMLRSKLSFTPKMGVSTPDLKDIDSFKLDEPTPVAEVKDKVQQEKAPEPEKVKVEQQKQAEPEPEAKEEQQKQPVQEKHPEEVKEEQEKQPQEEVKEPEPEQEDVSPDDSELPEFDIVDKGIEGQEEKQVDLQEVEVEAEKALEATMLGTVSDAAAESAELENVAPVADANEEEVAGDSVQLPEQVEDKAVIGKSPPPRFGWRTLAMIVTPIAVIVSRTLAAAR